MYKSFRIRKRRLAALFSLSVPGRGLEPPHLTTYAPQAYLATSYSTRAGTLEPFADYTQHFLNFQSFT